MRNALRRIEKQNKNRVVILPSHDETGNITPTNESIDETIDNAPTNDHVEDAVNDSTPLIEAKKGGRPKGSTKAEMLDFSKRKKEALHEATLRHASNREESNKRA